MSGASNDSPLRIGIASITRFHMFDLARQIGRLGQKVTLFTGYPRWKIDQDLRESARTRSLWTVLSRLRHMRGASPAGSWWNIRTVRDFGLWLRRQVESDDLDVLDALDGTGLEAGPVLRDRG